MDYNIVEYLRRESINKLFKNPGFEKNWNSWKAEIEKLISGRTPNQILNLGDHLADIFKLTASSGRSQESLATGGNTWESLVCWYLNLCLIGRRTVVIKHNIKLLPAPIRDAITVNYSNFISNTESDLIAITFPDEDDYQLELPKIEVKDVDNNLVNIVAGGKINYLQGLNALSHRDFGKIEVHIIQCKTNWNDNAQIPMLWNMIYSVKEFAQNSITIGRNGYSINNIKKFTYSFVTVPTVHLSTVKQASTPVKRVNNLSGGNYWGYPSKTGIASNIKEMLSRNLASGENASHLNTLQRELNELNGKYEYFGLF